MQLSIVITPVRSAVQHLRYILLYAEYQRRGNGVDAVYFYPHHLCSMTIDMKYTILYNIIRGFSQDEIKKMRSK